MIKTWILGASAIAMTAMPVAATAAPVGANSAGSLSLAPATRAGTSTKKSSNLAGQSIVPLVIGAGIIAGVAYLIIDKENEDDSDSN
jgi:hypothetical protein